MRTPPIPWPKPNLPPEGLKVTINAFSRLTVGKEWSTSGRAEADVFHYLHFGIRGRARIRHRGEGFALTPGRASWLWGNVPVEREPAAGYDHAFVRFRLESVHGIDPLIDSPGGRPMDLGPFDFEAWFAPLRHSPARLHIGLESLVLGWAARHVVDLDRLLADHRARWARFPSFFAAIESRLGADLKIRDLALGEGMKTNAFTNVFRRHLGLSPKDHLNRRLFREACTLLTTTDGKIREIAKTLRFGDEYYFNRFFRKMAGCSPGDYRKIRGSGLARPEPFRGRGSRGSIRRRRPSSRHPRLL